MIIWDSSIIGTLSDIVTIGGVAIIAKEVYVKIKNDKLNTRTIPLRVDTLNNKSANPRGCFVFPIIPQLKS